MCSSDLDGEAVAVADPEPDLLSLVLAEVPLGVEDQLALILEELVSEALKEGLLLEEGVAENVEVALGEKET